VLLVVNEYWTRDVSARSPKPYSSTIASSQWNREMRDKTISPHAAVSVSDVVTDWCQYSSNSSSSSSWWGGVSAAFATGVDFSTKQTISAVIEGRTSRTVTGQLMSFCYRIAQCFVFVSEAILTYKLAKLNYKTGAVSHPLLLLFSRIVWISKLTDLNWNPAI